MSKRKSYEIKRKILFTLKEQDLTYSELERKINTGYRTIKLNCEELENFGQIKIISEKKHPTNGKNYKIVKITKEGINFLKNKKI